MKSDDTPMWQDPSESELVRDLLTAGRSAEADYDVAQGLHQHLAQIQAGAPLPKWAEGGMGAASSGSLVTWMVVPVVTASVAAAVWFAARDTSSGDKASVKATRPVAAEIARSAQVEGKAPVEPPREPFAEPALEPTHEHSLEANPAARASAPKAERDVASRVRRTTAQRTPASSHSARSHSARDVQAAPAVSARIPDELPLRGDSAASGAASSSSRADQRATQAPAAAQTREGASETQATLPTATTQEAKAEKSESKLEREMQMLAVAQRVLVDDPARALRMAEQGEREFGRSMFSAERKNVQALALVKLGRIDDARRVGKALLAKYPNAPFSQRLRKALVSGRVE